MPLINGTAALKVDGNVLDNVEYKISILEPGPNQHGRADGYVWGRTEPLTAALGSSDVSLIRDDSGEEVRITVTSFAPGEGAQIAVTGSPGRY